MKYEEFIAYKPIENPLTTFAHGYQLSNGELFYVEPWFYTQFRRIIERFPERQEDMVAYMIDKVKRYKHVVFTRDHVFAIIKDPKYVAVEIDDLIAALKIIIDDNSRGSDYGD